MYLKDICLSSSSGCVEPVTNHKAANTAVYEELPKSSLNHWFNCKQRSALWEYSHDKWLHFWIIHDCWHVWSVSPCMLPQKSKHISSSVHSNQSAAAQICCSNPNRLTVFTNLLHWNDTKTLCKGVNYCTGKRLFHFSAHWLVIFRCSAEKERILRWLSNMEDTWHNTKHMANNTTTKREISVTQLLYEHTDIRWSSCNLFKPPSVDTPVGCPRLYQGLRPACCSFPSGSLPGWAGQIRRWDRCWTGMLSEALG